MFSGKYTTMYHEITHGILISVMPVYIDERSKPEDNLYFWAYRVVIKNNSTQTVQLLSRYWRISDGVGNIEVVEGEGVVGEKPILEPSGQFEYTSGCPLATPSGIMVGTYTMKIVNNGEQTSESFKVNIPAFSLDLPDAAYIIN